MVRTNASVEARNLRFVVCEPPKKAGTSGELADKATFCKQILNPSNRTIKAQQVDVSNIHMGTIKLYGINDSIKEILLDPYGEVVVDLDFEARKGTSDWCAVHLERVRLSSLTNVSPNEADGHKDVVRVNYSFRTSNDRQTTTE